MGLDVILGGLVAAALVVWAAFTRGKATGKTEQAAAEAQRQTQDYLNTREKADEADVVVGDADAARERLRARDPNQR